jgi:hypothetical protein
VVEARDANPVARFIFVPIVQTVNRVTYATAPRTPGFQPEVKAGRVMADAGKAPRPIDSPVNTAYGRCPEGGHAAC